MRARVHWVVIEPSQCVEILKLPRRHSPCRCIDQQTSIPQGENPVKAMNQIRSMQRHHHRFRTVGEGAISVSFQKAIEYFGGNGWIQTGQRLIGENQRRLLPEQPGQGNALSLTT